MRLALFNIKYKAIRKALKDWKNVGCLFCGDWFYISNQQSITCAGTWQIVENFE